MSTEIKQITLEGQQLVALDFSLDPMRRLVSITGPAGSGKTSIMRQIVSRQNRNALVAVAAPTGKAARRVTEATGVKAVTLHKLLGFGKPEIDPDTGMAVSATRPSFNRDTPLPHSLVLVDEYAMVHEGLHRDLMDALGRGSKLIVFGDVDQLPPIEEHELKSLSGEPYKSPFERLLNTRSAVVLDTVYRQSEGSGILHNATLIRNGKSPVRRDDFKIVVTDTPLKWIRDFANETTLDLADTKNQVILPVKVTDIGTHKVNTILQSVLNPAALRGLALPRYKHEEKYPLSVSVGDKVLCTENMYDMRDYFQRYERWQNDITPVHSSFIPCPDNFQMLNGEIGIITDITEDDGLVVDFGDRWVTIPPSFRDVNQYKRMVNVDPRKRISLGYAITVHKSQGSEFDNVVYMQHSVCSFMLSRNLVYTAVTRARDLVYYVTDSRQYNNSVRLTAKEKMINMLRNKK